MNTDLSPRDLVVDLLGRSSLKVQMAAVLSDRQGRIFSWGWNSGYTHAEMMAIVRANPRRLRGATITVAGRRAKSGNAVHARPCSEHCYRRIVSCGIGRIDFRDTARKWVSLIRDTARTWVSLKLP